MPIVRMHIHSSNPVMSAIFAINFCRQMRRGIFFILVVRAKFEQRMPNKVHIWRLQCSSAGWTFRSALEQQILLRATVCNNIQSISDRRRAN